MFYVVLTLAALASPASSFYTRPVFLKRPVVSSSKLSDTPSTATDLFKSEGWKSIQKELSPVPVWAVANADGQPIQCEVNSVMTALFFVEVADAQAELAKAKAEVDAVPLDLVPFPLSEAFMWWCEDKAMLVPSLNAIQAAGAPQGAEPMGQQIPLFACLEMQAEGKDGKPTLPLFFVHAEAKKAMDTALEVDGTAEDKATFKIVNLSLQRAVELLATVPSTPAFQFVTPASSSKYVASYLGT